MDTVDDPEAEVRAMLGLQRHSWIRARSTALMREVAMLARSPGFGVCPSHNRVLLVEGLAMRGARTSLLPQAPLVMPRPQRPGMPQEPERSAIDAPGSPERQHDDSLHGRMAFSWSSLAHEDERSATQAADAVLSLSPGRTSPFSLPCLPSCRSSPDLRNFDTGDHALLLHLLTQGEQGAPPSEMVEDHGYLVGRQSPPETKLACARVRPSSRPAEHALAWEPKKRLRLLQ
jgi:hypothetical protein